MADAGGCMTSEAVFRCLVKVYPAAYRGADAKEMKEDFAEHLSAARREGRKGVLGLWARVVPDQVVGIVGAWAAVLGRKFGAVVTPHLLAVLCGIAAFFVGASLTADGVMAWISMALFFEHPGLPKEVPLGFLENRFLTISLTVAALAGLFVITGLKSSLARCGAMVASAWVVLTLFLVVYDAVAEPVYYSYAGFGLGEPQDVDQFAIAVRQLKSWSIAFATLLAGLALAFRNPRRRWWILLLAVSFMKSPLADRSVLLLWEYSMQLEAPMGLMLTLHALRGLLIHMVIILPGFSWVLLGCLILANSGQLKAGPPNPSRGAANVVPRSRG